MGGNFRFKNNNQENLFFVVETSTVQDGKELKSIQKDKDGYYKGFPLAVYGAKTRNNTVYDVPSIIKQITDPNSTFNIRLTEGNLIGEWGHPLVDPTTKMGLQRVLTLEPAKEACHYRKVYSKKLDDSDMIVIFGDLKPSGPYGKYFEERMDDPTVNCAASLRALTKDRFDRASNTLYRNVQSLVTFDIGVPSGGYKEASKRYMVSFEEIIAKNIEEVFSYETVCAINHSVGLESFTNTELNDILGARKITIGEKVVGVIDANNGILYNIETKEKQGLVRSMLQLKRKKINK